MAELEYRPCVLGVFTNDDGLVLVAERSRPKGAWQFPQGGIDPGETPEAAVMREMYEELGSRQVTIVARTEMPVRYQFPPGMHSPLSKQYRGQDQIWFHLRFSGDGRPDLSAAPDDEFISFEWVTPAEALRRIVDFKKSAYEDGLKQLGLLPPRNED